MIKSFLFIFYFFSFNEVCRVSTNFIQLTHSLPPLNSFLGIERSSSVIISRGGNHRVPHNMIYTINGS